MSSKLNSTIVRSAKGVAVNFDELAEKASRFATAENSEEAPRNAPQEERPTIGFIPPTPPAKAAEIVVKRRKPAPKRDIGDDILSEIASKDED